jgi:hypothetical protein
MLTKELPTVEVLRERYEQTGSAAAVVQLLASVVPESVLDWAIQMQAAFNLSLSQISPIGGWLPDGTGELKDSQLDGFLVPEIERTRNSWNHQ